MHRVSGTVEGVWEINDEVALTGMAAGDVVVASGGVLHLEGMCCRSLRIEQNGTVWLRGTVIGDVINAGGSLNVHGTIQGQLVDPNALAVIHPGAMIGGVRK